MKIKIGLFLFVFFASQYICSSWRQYKTFRCRNEYDFIILHYEYIPNTSFCNGYQECMYKEDEGQGCKLRGKEACGQGMFACDGQCKNTTVRCNTINDCKDGTDELNCGDEIQVKNCTSKNKFLCKDGLRCLGFEYTCDDVCNCFDCSDENENCTKVDYDLLEKCPDAYFRTTKGPQCICESNSTSSSEMCDLVRECSDRDLLLNIKKPECGQRCIAFKTKTQCTCHDGYHLTAGICRNTENIVILFANAREIKSLNITSSLETSTILKITTNCTILTAANNYAYYATLSQDNRGSIFKVSLNSQKPENLIDTDFPITSISVDYITNNVYFTANGSLSVCSNNGRTCTQLKCCNVSSVTLAPKYGWMFYVWKQDSNVDDCRNFLTRSNMDGSDEFHSRCFNHEVLIEMDELDNKIHMLIPGDDIVQPVLYSVTVDSIFQNIDVRKNFTVVTKRMKHFSFHNGEIFFTTYDTSGIFYVPRDELKSEQSYLIKYSKLYLHDTGRSSISDLYVYNSASQRGVKNPCANISCSGLCLLKSGMQQSHYILNHTCVIPAANTSTSTHWISIATCILIVLFILTGTIYYIFVKKCNWHGYSLAFQTGNIRRSESYDAMINNN